MLHVTDAVITLFSYELNFLLERLSNEAVYIGKPKLSRCHPQLENISDGLGICDLFRDLTSIDHIYIYARIFAIYQTLNETKLMAN